MNILVPVDISKATVEQRDEAFKFFCGRIMGFLPKHGAGGVLKFIDKGDPGLASEDYNIQGAQVWIEVPGAELKYNQLIPFNDMLAEDHPIQGRDTLRNDPDWYAGNLVRGALDKEQFPPDPESYGLLERPNDPDIVTVL